ncbi:teneurin-3 [Xiphias gladius]|uniref:teneurin-3 n=1 Tax=Xiphias gladius TaxID=8245 RepID=UPI001A98DBF7|nr:teneurin-3 [Xiphias gladius]
MKVAVNWERRIPTTRTSSFGSTEGNNTTYQQTSAIHLVDRSTSWWSPTTLHSHCLTHSLCLHPLSSSVFLSLCVCVCLSVYAAVQQHACMFATSTSRSIMEVKEQRPYCSLTKSRKNKEGPYTGSSGDSGDGAIGSQGLRVPTQKSYSSSETLKAFDQHQDQTRLLYGTTKGHKDMVHREQDDYNRQGQHFSLRQLGICEPPSRRGLAFCSEMGLPHRGFSVGTAQDLDTDSQAVMSPEHAMRLWGRGGLGKSSGRSSCLSSRSNSVLTLTDTEHENKSDSDNGSAQGWQYAVRPSVCRGPQRMIHSV